MARITDAIQARILEEGITQQELAERASTTPETVSRILKGRIKPVTKTMERILNELSLEVTATKK